MADEVHSVEITLSDVQLVQIGLNQISGQQFLVGEINSVNLKTEKKFAMENDSLIYLVSNELELKGPIGNIGLITATVVVVFKAPRVLGVDDQKLVSEVGGATLMIAQPVLREAISDIGNKLGIPRITLGLLRFGQDRPESVTIGENIFSFNQTPNDISDNADK